MLLTYSRSIDGSNMGKMELPLQASPERPTHVALQSSNQKFHRKIRTKINLETKVKTFFVFTWRLRI